MTKPEVSVSCPKLLSLGFIPYLELVGILNFKALPQELADLDSVPDIAGKWLCDPE